MKNCQSGFYKEYWITNDNALFFSALLIILHYSLAIWKNHNNALSLFFLANAQMSGGNPHIAGTFCLGETSYLWRDRVCTYLCTQCTIV